MKFDCLVIDPPWQYDNIRTGGTLKSGAEQKYQTLSLYDIMELAPLIQSVTKDNCIIFLWVTNSFLKVGLNLIESYGFDYKTLITWVKNGKGLGFWYRGNTEHIILGVKGDIKPFHSQEINVFHADTKQHSEKPLKSYELIEQGTKSIKKCKTLEIFARRYYKDWTCIGYDLDGSNITDALQRISKI